MDGDTSVIGVYGRSKRTSCVTYVHTAETFDRSFSNVIYGRGVGSDYALAATVSSSILCHPSHTTTTLPVLTLSPLTTTTVLTSYPLLETRTCVCIILNFFPFSPRRHERDVTSRTARFRSTKS